MSYHIPGSPSAYILAPATIVADPPTAVAVSVAVNPNVPILRSARKNPLDVFALFDE